MNQDNLSIPKVIHYCWFGGAELGSAELRCINSWRRFLPGYEIRRWDESSFDVSRCSYVKEAYEAGKWAFVSDYARFYILYRYGGLYFDTDVEMIRPIDDLIENGPFMGFELDSRQGENGTVAPGLGLCACPGLELYKDVIDSYKNDHFIKKDGSLNLETIVTRMTGLLVEHGLEQKSGIQYVDGITIYPADYFNPKNFWTGEMSLTENTRTIHHFGMSWYSDADKYLFEVERGLLKIFPRGKLAHRLAVIASTVRYRDFSFIRSHINKRWSNA